MVEAEKQVDQKVTEVLTIAIEQPSGKVMVRGALANKTLCLNVIGEAVKIIANFKRDESKIIKPGGIIKKPHSILNFARRRK